MITRSSRFGLIAAGVSMALAASAQEAQPPKGAAGENASESAVMEEIVVTAQKREESVQDVPISMQAFTGATLENAQVTDVAGLSRLVPNLNISRAAQTANIKMVIRGIGAAGNTAIDPSIGTFVDGIYIARPGSLFASFNDIASAEVLRGPQGTLFGRNATVGAINVLSASPGDVFGGSVGVEGGSYGWQKYTGVLNAPVGDRLAFRVAGLYSSTDGFIKNTVTGDQLGKQDTTAVRLGGTWRITDDLKWTVKYDYSKITGDGYLDNAIEPTTVTPAELARLNLIFAGNPPEVADPFNRKTNQFTEGNLDDKQWGLASDLSWNVGDGYTLRLLSGYRDWQNDQYDADVVYSTRPIAGRIGGYDSKSNSEELQLISPVDQIFGGRFDFVAGLYYFQEDFSILEQLSMLSQYCNTLVANPAQRAACNASGNKDNATVMNFKQDATNYAVYAQGNVRLIDNLTLVLGGRYTKDKKTGTFDQAVNNPFAAALRAKEYTKLKNDDDQPTWRFGLNWTPTTDLLFFGSYSTGYKSGGFNSGGGNVALGQRRLFDKETSTDYELGAKTTLAGGTAHFNITLFRMDLHDFQDRAFDGLSFNVVNAGNLRQQGVELDTDYLVTDQLRIYGALGYLDSEFTKYPNAACLPYDAFVNPKCTQDLKGEPNGYSPKWQGSAGAEMRGDLGFANLGYLFRADFSYVSEMSVSSVNDGNPQGLEPSHSTLSARYAVLFGKDRRYSVAVFGDNLTDTGYCQGRFATTLNTQFGLLDPATGGTVMRCAVAPPRTLGVALKANF
jgi:iron complex outermembrane receptor protein